MKTEKRIFLSLGIFTSTIVPIVAIISCTNSKTQKKLLKDISLDNVKKMGGIFGPKAKDNNYDLIRRFVFSLTNEKGIIFRSLIAFAKIKNKELGNQLADRLKKLNSDNLFKLLKVFYENGFQKMKKSDLNLFKILISNFENNDTKVSKIELYINMLKDLVNADNFKEYIVSEKGIFNVIKRFSSNAIISSFGPIFEKIQNGFYNSNDSNYNKTNYKNKILDFLLNQLNSIIGIGKSTSSINNLKKILGLSEKTNDLEDIVIPNNTMKSKPEEKNLFQILKEEIFSNYSSWSNIRLKYIENNKEEILKKSKNELTKKYLDKLIKQTKETEKERENVKTFVPFKKGFLNANENEMKNNLIFFQSLLQRFLLYFGIPNNVNLAIESMKLLNEDNSNNDIFEKIKIKIEEIISNRIFWIIASSSFTEYSSVIPKIIKKPFNGFLASEINTFIKILFILNEEEDPDLLNIKFTNNEVKILIKILLRGFDEMGHFSKDFDNAIEKILKLSNYEDKLSIWNKIKGLFFKFPSKEEA